ncbi:hypothetical protein [Sulfuritalea sp.]|uniref:hypothetical protein n=1 Tax=Sulfuritalea sp. TaxID=2480090 RepID=UPI00286EA04A|nr:hypothetical protein [Sulfuritalea sp.]
MRTLVAAIAFLVLASATASAQTQVNRPQKKVGDTCSYKQIDDWTGVVTDEYSLTIASVSDRGYGFVKKTKSGALGNFETTLDLNALSWGDTTYTPDSEYLAFPLYVGKTWEVKASYTKTNGMRGSYELVGTVVGEEKIGELVTVKITYEGHYRSTMSNGNSGSGRMKSVRWYAPSIGCTAKEVYEDTNWAGSPYNRNTRTLVNN